jgi:hypothetical protein
MLDAFCNRDTPRSSVPVLYSIGSALVFDSPRVIARTETVPTDTVDPEPDAPTNHPARLLPPNMISASLFYTHELLACSVISDLRLDKTFYPKPSQTPTYARSREFRFFDACCNVQNKRYVMQEWACTK